MEICYPCLAPCYHCVRACVCGKSLRVKDGGSMPCQRTGLGKNSESAGQSIDQVASEDRTVCIRLRSCVCLALNSSTSDFNSSVGSQVLMMNSSSLRKNCPYCRCRVPAVTCPPEQACPRPSDRPLLAAKAGPAFA